MGFWRDIGSSLGVCDDYSKDERKAFQQDRAAKLTRHPRGCDCVWCKCASDEPGKHR